MRWLIAGSLTISALFMSVFLAFNAGLFDGAIQKQVRTASAGTIQLGSLRLKGFWPVRLTVGPSRMTAQGFAVQLKGAQVELASLFPPYAVRLKVNQPVIQVQPEVSPQSGPKGVPAESAGGSQKLKKVLPIHLTVNVSEGLIALPQAQIGSIDLQIEQKLFLVSPARVRVTGAIQTPLVPSRLPLSVDGDQVMVGLDVLKASDLKVTVAGLQAVVSGASLLSEGQHRWVFAIDAPDLSRLPQPQGPLPIRDWQGAIQLKAEVLKPSASNDWRAEGQGSVRAVSGQLAIKEAQFEAEGLVKADATFKFSFANQAVETLQFKGEIDLGSARVTLKDWLEKPYQVPLLAKADIGLSSGKFQLTQLEAQLAQLLARVSGQMEVKGEWMGQLALSVPKVNLAGLQDLLVPLKKSPVRGEAALGLKLSGPLLKPLDARILIESLRFNNFSSPVNFVGDKFKIEGPLNANLSLVGEIDKSEPKRLEAQGQADLKKLGFTLGPLHKSPESEFSVAFKVAHRGSSLNIENINLSGFLGQIQVAGMIKSFNEKVVDLKVAAKSLNLSELRLALPEFREHLPKGEVTGQLRLAGQVAPEKPWQEWPLKISGDVAAAIPEYQMIETEAKDAKGVTEKAEAAVAAPPSPSFLPKGFLTQNLNLKIRFAADDFKKGTLLLKRMTASGQVSAGVFKGTAAIGEIFGGRTDLFTLEVPLLQPAAAIQGLVSWKDVSVEGALAFVKPEYRTMASGRLFGRAEFSTVLPSDPQFLTRLKAQGETKVEPATLSTVKLGEFLNALLSKLPIKTSPAKLEPLKGTAHVQFEVANQVVSIPSLEARDEDGSQLNVKGKVVLADMQGDFVGNFAWAQSGMKGCLLQGNADSAGRMVIPLAVKGDLMNPGLSPLSDTISKVGARALECEKNKLVEKVKQEGGKAVEKEAKKLLKSILGR